MADVALKISERESRFYREVFDYVRDSSIEILREFDEIDGIICDELSDEDELRCDHWICSIIVNFDEARIAIRLHYRSGVARHIAAQRTSLEPTDIPDILIRDIIQEYLNLIMGRIKTRYGSASVVVSLPKSQPANDLEGPRADNAVGNADYWKLTWPDCHFHFGCFITLERGVKGLESLLSKNTDGSNSDGDDGMEFF